MNPFTELEEELRCSLCLELFTEPRTLPCGHTYCTMCLQDVCKLVDIEQILKNEKTINSPRKGKYLFPSSIK